jgi:flagellar biosynthesis anti-sigma factor FlgM
MRIDLNPGTQPLPENQANANAAGARAGAGPASGALGEDQAQLSGVHVQVQALVAQALKLPETAQERVQALRQAVVAGKYRPAADQVAGALFSNLLKSAA